MYKICSNRNALACSPRLKKTKSWCVQSDFEKKTLVRNITYTVIIITLRTYGYLIITFRFCCFPYHDRLSALIILVWGQSPYTSETQWFKHIKRYRSCPRIILYRRQCALCTIQFLLLHTNVSLIFFCCCELYKLHTACIRYDSSLYNMVINYWFEIWRKIGVHRYSK